MPARCLRAGRPSTTAFTRRCVSPGSRSGRGDDFEALCGGYVTATLALQLTEHLSLVGGVQYQALGDYHHSFDGQNVEIDLRHSLFITLGLGYSF